MSPQDKGLPRATSGARISEPLPLVAGNRGYRVGACGFMSIVDMGSFVAIKRKS